MSAAAWVAAGPKDVRHDAARYFGQCGEAILQTPSNIKSAMHRYKAKMTSLKSSTLDDRVDLRKFKPKTCAFEAIHSAAQGLHRAGTIDQTTMREYDTRCLRRDVKVNHIAAAGEP